MRGKEIKNFNEKMEVSSRNEDEETKVGKIQKENVKKKNTSKDKKIGWRKTRQNKMKYTVEELAKGFTKDLYEDFKEFEGKKKAILSRNWYFYSKVIS